MSAVYFAAADEATLAAERALLGGLVTGVIGLDDVAGLHPYDMLAELHRGVFAVLFAALEAREDGLDVPGRRGIDLAWLVLACQHCDVWPAGAVYALSGGRRVALGYVPTLVREAPRRREARAACATLMGLARDRGVVADELADMLAAKALSFIAGARYFGSVETRAGERAVEQAVLPPADNRAAALRWAASLLAREAERERGAWSDRGAYGGQ